MGAGGAGGDDGDVGSLQTVAYGQVAGDHVDDVAGDVEGGDASGPAVHEDLRALFYPRQATDAGTDGDADAVRVLRRHFQPGILEGLDAGRHAVMDEGIHLALVFFRDVLLQVQTADGAADAHRKAGGVEVGYLGDAADPGSNVAPRLCNRVSDRGHQAQTGDHNAAFAHNIIPPCINEKGRFNAAALE